MVFGVTGCGPARLDPHADSAGVYYAATGRIRGFDPVRVGDVASILAIAKIYEPLYQYAYLERPYRVEPLLAAAMPAVSSDGLTYTIPIRPGIRFHPDPCFGTQAGAGREVTAGDFVYGIRRVADRKNASSGYWAFNDRIVGLDEWRETTGGDAPSDYDVPIEGLRAVDPHTLRIRLKRRYPQLLWILTLHYSAAVPREAVEYYGDQFLNHPVGTGPYRLKSWEKNYRVEYVRNPDWGLSGRRDVYPAHGEPGDAAAGLLQDAGAPLPFMDRIVELVIQDPHTRWLMFLSGQLSRSGLSRDKMSSVVDQHMGLNAGLRERGIRLTVAPTMTIEYLGFNMDDPVVGSNRKLRQAMTCAFDTEKWEAFWKQRVVRPAGPIPPGVAGYVDQSSPFAFDLERARRLLAEAGYPDGIDPATGRRLQLTLELGLAQTAEVRDMVDLFRSFMDRIGIDIQAQYWNRATFFDRLDRNQIQMYRLSWIADYPDGENFLQLFYGPNSAAGPNHSNYRNASFDALYEQARHLQDSPERTALYRAMAEIVIDDCPWIFAGIPLDYELTHAWLQNYKHHDFPYGMEKYLRVEEGRAGRNANREHPTPNVER